MEIKDIAAVLQADNITVRGVVDVGAYTGDGLAGWEALGARKVLAFEPATAAFLQLMQAAAKANRPGFNVRCFHLALGDANEDGPPLSIMNAGGEQSNSLLPLAKHAEYYPSIRPVGSEPVRIRRLDGLPPVDDYNFLKVDAQGFEHRVLKGAMEALRGIDAVQVEMAYEELYAGGAAAAQVEGILDACGFRLMLSERPYHPSWGDALFVKRAITCSTIGQNGRWGNQIFQYMIAWYIAKQTGWRLQLPDSWIGPKHFGINHPRPTQRPGAFSVYPWLGEDFPTHPVQGDSDLFGYFQFHTRFYAKYRDDYRRIFTPRNIPAGNHYDDGEAPREAPLVVFHIRRGDYLTLGHDFCLAPPMEWYHEKVAQFRAAGGHVVIVSDDPEVSTTHGDEELDWWLMTRADVLIAANSTFSITAAMMNTRPGALFMRPTWDGTLAKFDPWDTPVLFRRGTK